MKTALLFLVAAALSGAAAAQSVQQPNIDKLLASIRSKDAGQLAVSEEDGRLLRLLVASTNRKRVLEILSAHGLTNPEAVGRSSAAWQHAAARTPHGAPIVLQPQDFD